MAGERLENILIAGEGSNRLLSRIIAGAVESSTASAVILFDPAGRLPEWIGIAETINRDFDFVERLRGFNKLVDLRQVEQSEGAIITNKRQYIVAIPELAELRLSRYNKALFDELSRIIYRSEGLNISVAVASRYASALMFPPGFVSMFSERWAAPVLTTAESRRIIGVAGAENLLRGQAFCRSADGLHKIRIETVTQSMLNDIKKRIC